MRPNAAGLRTYQPRGASRQSRRSVSHLPHGELNLPYSCTAASTAEAEIGLTYLTLSCAAKAHEPKPQRRGGCRE